MIKPEKSGTTKNPSEQGQHSFLNGEIEWNNIKKYECCFWNKKKNSKKIKWGFQ